MNDYLKSALENFTNVSSKKPELYLSVHDGHAKEIEALLKTSYDFTKSNESKLIKSDALPELIVEEFDLEQIWQQLELQNESFLTRSIAKVTKFTVRKDKLIFKEIAKELEEHNEEEQQENNTSGEESSDESNDDLPPPNLDESDNSDELSLNGDELSDELEPKAKKFRASAVDDKFFKLGEMEAFLNAEEKRENDQEPDSGNDSESNDDEEAMDDDIDLFNNDSDDMENNSKERGQLNNPKYKDFFGEADEEDVKKTKRNKFLEENEDDDDDDVEKQENNDIQENSVKPKNDEQINDGFNIELKSSLELREERLKRKIGYIEEAAIAEKPWQLKGEITAEGRPQNSLLEEVVEFDLTTRPAPVITEATTLILEDVIRQRIKDKAFDSVERKQRAVETPLEYKKKLVLDQEKSKQSLAQIYEKEYLDQKEALNPDAGEKEEVEPQLHKEIKEMARGLFAKLDALSNFHFTPKPAQPELKIVSNLPAVSMEEVAPVAASDAAMLAPEEIRRKNRSDAIGKSERTETDKKRERRRKKQLQKKHSLENAKKTNLGKQKLLEQVTKDRNIQKMDETVGSKSIKSSTAFFTQLQDEARSQIKSKLKDRKKNKTNLDAKKFKF